MKPDNLTYLFAAWLLAFCGLFFMFVRERSLRIEATENAKILGDTAFVLQGQIATFGGENERLAKALEECRNK